MPLHSRAIPTTQTRGRQYQTMAYFIEITPEIRERTKARVKRLEKPVRDLNERILPRFSECIKSNVRFPKVPLASMSDQYNRDYEDWLFNGAIEDFVTKMEREYDFFDADAYEDARWKDSEEEPLDIDPMQFVTRRKRSVSFGFSGSVWIDLPVTGTDNKGQRVTKWTRASFEYHYEHFSFEEHTLSFPADGEEPSEDIPVPFWTVRLDPTDDCLNFFFDAARSAEHVKLMTTGGVDVQLGDV